MESYDDVATDFSSNKADVYFFNGLNYYSTSGWTGSISAHSYITGNGGGYVVPPHPLGISLG